MSPSKKKQSDRWQQQDEEILSELMLSFVRKKTDFIWQKEMFRSFFLPERRKLYHQRGTTEFIILADNSLIWEGYSTSEKYFF